MPLARRPLLLGTAALPYAALAQDAWPSRPVRIVVAFAPGGSIDLLARLVSAGMERRFGRPFPVENRSGASGQVGTAAVSRAPGDGYTLLVTSSAAHGVAPGLHPNLPYDAVQGFTHLGLIASGPVGFMVSAASPWQSMAEFAAAARSRGAPMPFSSGGTGSLGHLTGELVARRMQIPLQHIPYRGAAPAQGDLLAGTLAAISDSLPPHAELIRAGRLRCLGLSSAARYPGFPGVPTFAEMGHPDLVTGAWFGLCGSPGIPAPIVGQLNAALRDMLQQPDVREQIEKLGLQPEGGMSAADYTGFVASEVARWREVIRLAGVTAE